MPDAMFEHEPNTTDFNWTAELERDVDDVISRATLHLNRHTATTVWHIDGRTLHAKASVLSLATEAALLKAELGRPDASGAHAVRLIAFNAVRNVVVTDYVHGQSLFNVLWNGVAFWTPKARTTGLAVHASHAAARWLKQFHDAYQVSDPSPDEVDACRDAVLTRVTDTLRSFPDAPNCPFQASELRLLASRAHLLEQSSDWSSLPLARIHGDFTTHANVIVDNKGAVFIADFGDSRLGFRLEDVVRLWTSIWEIGATRLWARSKIAGVLDRLLIINEVPPESVQFPPFALLRMLFALRRVREAQLGLPGAPWHARRLLKRLAAPQLRWLRGAQ